LVKNEWRQYNEMLYIYILCTLLLFMSGFWRNTLFAVMKIQRLWKTTKIKIKIYTKCFLYIFYVYYVYYKNKLLFAHSQVLHEGTCLHVNNFTIAIKNAIHTTDLQLHAITNQSSKNLSISWQKSLYHKRSASIKPKVLVHIHLYTYINKPVLTHIWGRTEQCQIQLLTVINYFLIIYYYIHIVLKFKTIYYSHRINMFIISTICQYATTFELTFYYIIIC